MNKITEKNYCAVDVAKFVFAVLVVSIHLFGNAFKGMAQDGAPPTGNGNLFVLFGFPLYYLFARLAVPFFFLASGYFLFGKIERRPNEAGTIVRGYCARILKLFAFWLVVSIPIIVDKYFIDRSVYATAKEGALAFGLKILTGGGVRGVVVSDRVGLICAARLRYGEALVCR